MCISQLHLGMQYAEQNLAFKVPDAPITGLESHTKLNYIF